MELIVKEKENRMNSHTSRTYSIFRGKGNKKSIISIFINKCANCEFYTDIALGI